MGAPGLEADGGRILGYEWEGVWELRTSTRHDRLVDRQLAYRMLLLQFDEGGRLLNHSRRTYWSGDGDAPTLTEAVESWKHTPPTRPANVEPSAR